MRRVFCDLHVILAYINIIVGPGLCQICQTFFRRSNFIKSRSPWPIWLYYGLLLQPGRSHRVSCRQLRASAVQTMQEDLLNHLNPLMTPRPLWITRGLRELAHPLFRPWTCPVPGLLRKLSPISSTILHLQVYNLSKSGSTTGYL